MTLPLTIGRLAREAGMPISTLRFYEREGLLAPEGRSAGNYRLYSTVSLHRLLLVRNAREHGLTLADVRTLLPAKSYAEAARRLQTILRRRLGGIETEIRKLTAVRDRVRRTLRRLGEDPSGGRLGWLEPLRRVRAV